VGVTRGWEECKGLVSGRQSLFCDKLDEAEVVTQ